MDVRRNPYVPSAGAQPPELTGRRPFLDQAEAALDRALVGRYAKSFIAVGLRGVGKTVLLNRVKELAAQRQIRVALIEAHEEKSLPALLAPELRRITLELDRLGKAHVEVKRAIGVFRSLVRGVKLKVGDFELGLDVAPEIGTADSGDLEADLPAMMEALGRAAAARGTAVAILIDELQYLEPRELSALVMALHRTAQSSLPVMMAGAGLPPVIAKIGNSKSYAERLLDFPEIGQLGAAEAKRALAEPAREEGVVFENDALEAVLSATRGYPFFLQEWGYQAWNIAQAPRISEPDVQAATIAAIARLDQSFFRMRLDRLTPSERRYLRAMAELGPGPHRSGDIATCLGSKITSVGPLRGKLIAKGMVYAPQHGDTAFTVPLFDEYMRRAMPFERA